MSAQSADAAPTERTIHVIQGEYRICDDENVVLSTVLGSCVAACMRDPIAKVGGMNHFLLPGDANAKEESLKYGIHSMELLINGLLQRGAVRSRLEAKLFGGARVVEGLSDIGQKNAEFAAHFLRAEGIRCIGDSLGGERGRRVRYWPVSGRAIQLFLDRSEPSVVRVERASRAPADTGSVELF